MVRHKTVLRVFISLMFALLVTCMMRPFEPASWSSALFTSHPLTYNMYWTPTWYIAILYNHSDLPPYLLRTKQINLPSINRHLQLPYHGNLTW